MWYKEQGKYGFNIKQADTTVLACNFKLQKKPELSIF